MTEYYVSGVIEIEGTCGRVTDEDAEFFTLYGKDDQGLSQCIADFTDRLSAEAAMQVYQERDALQQQVNDLQDKAYFKQNLTEQIVDLQKQVNALKDQLSGEKIARERLKDALRDAGQELARLKAQGLRLPDEMPRQYKNGWPLNYSDEALGWNECLAEVTRLNATVPAEPRTAVLPPEKKWEEPEDGVDVDYMSGSDAYTYGELKGYNQAIADAKALSCQPHRFVVKLPEAIPRALYQVIYDECGAFVDCDADPQKIWDAFRKVAGGEIAE